jgi:hypothetical protein
MALDKLFSEFEHEGHRDRSISKKTEVNWRKVLEILVRVKGTNEVYVDEFDGKDLQGLYFAEDMNWVKFGERKDELGRIRLTKQGEALYNRLANYLKESIGEV